MSRSKTRDPASPSGLPGRWARPIARWCRRAIMLLLAACAIERPPKTPLDTLTDPTPPSHGPKVLLVFMPGAQEVPADIVARGFVAMVRARNIAADVVVADTHVGYFRAGTVLQRLQDDVIAPARGRGYAGIWLAGISLGGLGALLYAADVDAQGRPPIDGVLAIAPFLGAPRLVDEVAAAGGLSPWQPRDPVAATDRQRLLLLWLKGYGGASAATRPPLFLGYGAQDRFAAANALLGDLLPPGHVFIAPGGHDWAPWEVVWGQMLDRAPLPRVLAAP
jgi:hypothetical protein